MVSPSQKKLAVAHIVQQRLCSVRRACTYLSLPRSTYRYVPKPLADHQEQLYQRIIALSWHHPRYGYRRIRALLAREGWTVSRKQVQRIRRREGLKSPSKTQEESPDVACPLSYRLRPLIVITYGPWISSLIGPIMADY